MGRKRTFFHSPDSSIGRIYAARVTALQPQPLPERTAHQAVQAMMVVEPVRAEVLPVTMQQAVERTRVLQQEFQEAL